MSTQSGRWVRRGSRVVVLPGTGGAPARELEAETSGPAAAAPKTSPPPRGLALLPHFHDPKTLPSPTALGSPRPMRPAAMNPGFVDPVTDALVTSTAPTGLQARLRALIASRYRKHENRIGVALVDLTGRRLFAPDFAGWRSTAAMYGASLPKICALYPAHQLRFDLQTLAAQRGLTTRKALVDAMRAVWDAAKLPRKRQPALDELFDYTEAPPRPVAVRPSRKLDEMIRCVYALNCNWTASLLIDRVGLAYVGSVLWQSGLFHPTRGGLWLGGSYGAGCDCKQRPGEPGCCFRPSRLEKAPQPVAVTPSSGSHNATALSAATYFTLMAQGRLADEAASARIRRDLEPGCSLFWAGQLSCLRIQGPPSKCGIYKGFYHDVILVERSVGPGPGCGGKVIRYVVALLSSDAGKAALFPPFLAEVDALVQQNNP